MINIILPYVFALSAITLIVSMLVIREVNVVMIIIACVVYLLGTAIAARVDKVEPTSVEPPVQNETQIERVDTYMITILESYIEDNDFTILTTRDVAMLYTIERLSLSGDVGKTYGRLGITTDTLGYMKGVEELNLQSTIVYDMVALSYVDNLLRDTAGNKRSALFKYLGATTPYTQHVISAIYHEECTKLD